MSYDLQISCTLVPHCTTPHTTVNRIIHPFQFLYFTEVRFIQLFCCSAVPHQISYELLLQSVYSGKK